MAQRIQTTQEIYEIALDDPFDRARSGTKLYSLQQGTRSMAKHIIKLNPSQFHGIDSTNGMLWTLCQINIDKNALVNGKCFSK